MQAAARARAIGVVYPALVSHETDDISTIPRSHFEEASLSRARYRLTVTKGRDRGLSLVVDATRPFRALVGHSAACELRLTDLGVSRRHCSVDLTRRGLRVSDLASMNGTVVGGVRIVEALLAGGEDILIGDTTIHVERLAEDGPAGAAGAAPAPAMPKADRTDAPFRFGRVIGASPEMRRLFPLCERLAAEDGPILVEGEPGTGKETLAEALHDASSRAAAPFVVFDCNAVRGAVMGELLFGPGGGAFGQAAGGTLFIDEIGEIDPQLQPKLLCAIERKELEVGDSKRTARADVRVIAATSRNLDQEVQAGRFREDLLLVLSHGRVELPPLRDRTGDVGVLTRHFWRQLGGEDKPMPRGLVERFTDLPWPGNVRELQEAVARTLAAGDVVLDESGARPGSAPPLEARDIIDAVVDSDLPLSRARDRVVAELERRYVQRLLERHGGNVSRAAAASGLARRYFQLLKARHLKGR
jgi:transcriptional regulator with AAA-type ATPase domain